MMPKWLSAAVAGRNRDTDNTMAKEKGQNYKHGSTKYYTENWTE